MLLETRMSNPDSCQKALPHRPETFLVFFRRPASEGPRFGAPLTIDLRSLSDARDVIHCQRTHVETAEPNFTLHSRTNHVAFTAGCTLFTQRQKVCRAPFSSQKKVHVISPHPIVNLHLFTHVAKSNNHIEANQKYNQQLHRSNHTNTTTFCKPHWRNNSRTKRAQRQPHHRQR